MRLERYIYRFSLEFPQYEFESEGPKGTIKKVVRYNKMKGSENLYNLAFGDLDEKTGEINDFITSNNTRKNTGHCSRYGNRFYPRKTGSLNFCNW